MVIPALTSSLEGKRYRTVRRFQFLLFVLSITFGSRLIWIVNHANWKVNLKQVGVHALYNNLISNTRQQCPPLATAWILAIAALELGPAVMSLVIVGGWSWWSQMKLAR